MITLDGHWLATSQLAWFKRKLTDEEVAHERAVFDGESPTHVDTPTLCQAWRCLDTNKTEWRPLPLVVEGADE